jgi:TolA-binding protein
MDIATAALVILGAIVIALIWFAATRLRAADSVHYRTVATRGADAQEEANKQLSDIQAQLTDMNRRIAQVERILQDAE